MTEAQSQGSWWGPLDVDALVATVGPRGGEPASRREWGWCVRSAGAQGETPTAAVRIPAPVVGDFGTDEAKGG